MKLYIHNVHWLHDPTPFSQALALVDPERREKTLSHHFTKDRALTLGAHLLLHYALFHQNPTIPQPPQLRYNPHGKPYLLGKDAPFFNLSHAGHYVACALSQQAVGVDIEERSPVDEPLARRCFTDNELSAVLTANSLDTDAFFRLWTLKESYLKYLGSGLSLDLLSFEVVEGNPLRIRHQETLQTCCLQAYDALTGYKLALCGESTALPTDFTLVTQEQLVGSLFYKVKTFFPPS
jgi:4'-phosphopantetheinyl transferase